MHFRLRKHNFADHSRLFNKFVVIVQTRGVRPVRAFRSRFREKRQRGQFLILSAPADAGFCEVQLQATFSNKFIECSYLLENQGHYN